MLYNLSIMRIFKIQNFIYSYLLTSASPCLASLCESSKMHKYTTTTPTSATNMGTPIRIHYNVLRVGI